MKNLQAIVIALGVMIIIATTALVVLVIKKSGNGDKGAGGQNSPAPLTRGNYVTSYGVAGNLVVVLDQGKGKKTINLYDGKNLHLLSTLVIDQQ